MLALPAVFALIQRRWPHSVFGAAVALVHQSPLREATDKVKAAKNIRIVPTAPMFAQAILNIWGGMSVSSLFETDTLVPIYEGFYPRG